jgi:hypothetical protein
MMLRFFEFDYSEDTEGVGVFDAMASVGPQQVAVVHDEVAQVLRWAHDHFPHGRGPVGEGFDWDYDLQSQQEYTVSEAMVFDERTGTVSVRPQTKGVPRHTVTLSLSGSDAFCHALREQFDLS